MSVQLVVVLMLVLGMCILFSVFAGLIGFGVARLVKMPVDRALGWGSVVAFSVMTLSVAVLSVVVPLVT